MQGSLYGFPLPQAMTVGVAGMTGPAPHLWIADQVRNDDAYASRPVHPVDSRFPRGMTAAWHTDVPILWILDQVQNDDHPHL